MFSIYFQLLTRLDLNKWTYFNSCLREACGGQAVRLGAKPSPIPLTP
ncbi:MAG: hypothetical protein RML94_02900 [Bacteroidia bacterium]|nr:hypothetical protein [Bacteroidia bacterium]